MVLTKSTWSYLLNSIGYYVHSIFHFLIGYFEIFYFNQDLDLSTIVLPVIIFENESKHKATSKAH